VKWLLVAMIASACGSKTPPTADQPSLAKPGVVASNVLREDYAGSEKCADCHAEIYKRWAASPMRNMTREIGKAQVRAPFNGATLTVGDFTATMEMVSGVRYVKIATPDSTVRFRVTKVVGGRYREDFIGVEEPATPVAQENVLPATYVFSTKSWRYKGYSVMVKERSGMSWKGVWSQECIACHNTMPLAFNLYDDLYGAGSPPYQGKLSDRTVPKRLAWTARTLDADGLALALGNEIKFLGGNPTATTARPLLKEVAVTTQNRLDGSKLVEVGIGCEACHNGSLAHVTSPEIKPSFAVQSKLIGLAPPKGQQGTKQQWINHTCAKCHTVLFTRYPYTWEGASRRKDPGGSTTNSGEGRDYKLGGCASAMTCTTCHDPHGEDSRAALDALATPAGNKTCAPCHAEIAANVTGHSHHQAGSVGTSCVACHMPKKNMGLDYALVRYHRIGSPTADVRVTGDRPLECALCHADKSVETLVTTMEQWWKKSFDREALKRLYGNDLGVNAIRATLEKGKPHEQATAIIVLGDRRDRGAIKAVAGQLSHPYPLVRYYAHRALETIIGGPVEVDVNAAAPIVRQAADAWLATQRN
jgi:predicted CXXCH cytochrome family protein